MRKKLSLGVLAVLIPVLLCVVLATAAQAASEAADSVRADIRALEAERLPADPTETDFASLLGEVEALVTAHERYVPDSARYEDGGFFWKTDDGITSCYDPAMRVLTTSAEPASAPALDTDTAVVTVKGALHITVQPESFTSRDLYGDYVETVKVKAEGGTEPYSYQWYRDGEAIFVGVNISYLPRASGAYFCLVTDADGKRVVSRTVTASDYANLTRGETLMSQVVLTYDTATDTATCYIYGGSGDYSVVWFLQHGYTAMGGTLQYKTIRQLPENSEITTELTDYGAIVRYPGVLERLREAEGDPFDNGKMPRILATVYESVPGDWRKLRDGLWLSDGLIL